MKQLLEKKTGKRAIRLLLTGKVRQGKAKQGKRGRKQSREREVVSTLKKLKEQSAFKFILASST